MKLNTKGRYAVMALVDMACQNDLDEPVSLQRLSDNLYIKVNYLEQIFLKLRKCGLVKSIRGPRGGYILCKDASLISVIEVIKAVDEPLTMTRCTGNGSTCMKNGSKCLTHNLWYGLSEVIHNYFANYSISDISKGKIVNSNSCS